MEQSQCGLLEKIIRQDQELIGTGRWLRGSVNSSLVVDTEKQIFYFNTKDIKGNVIDWLIKVKGYNYSLAKEYIESFESFYSPFPRQVVNDKRVIVPFERLVDSFHSSYSPDVTDYWSKRGINDSTIKRFRLGLYKDDYRDVTWNTIPIFLGGKFYNFQLRTDTPEKMIRSYYTGLGPMPFNFDILGITDTIIICEGPADCIRLSQEGVPCVSHTSGASNWRTEWFSYFIKQKRIYILYDNDEAGLLGAKKVAEKLGSYRAKIYTFSDFDKKGYDVVDYFRDGYTSTELMKLLEAKSIYSFSIT